MAKVAMIGANPCFPDYRVIKEAESLANEGHHVRIYCTTRKDVPIYEVVSGVEYMRIPFSIGLAFRRLLDFNYSKRKRERQVELDEHIERYDSSGKEN